MSPPLRAFRPVRGKHETANALGNTDRHAAGRIDVRVAGRVVISHHDNVGTAQLLAMLGLPLWFFVRLACALRIAGCRDADRP